MGCFRLWLRELFSLKLILEISLSYALFLHSTLFLSITKNEYSSEVWTRCIQQVKSQGMGRNYCRSKIIAYGVEKTKAKLRPVDDEIKVLCHSVTHKLWGFAFTILTSWKLGSCD